MTFKVQDLNEDSRNRTCETRAEAEDIKGEMEGLGLDVEIQEDDSPDVVDHTEPAPEPEPVTDPQPVDTDVVEPADLSENPIEFLRSVNGDFVNVIKGTPAISKRGFRFIQREFEITTESEVVQWVDDPLGCVVWARAELNDEYAAEAHGEGYQFEGGVSNNEFVRYADTRAKNRAISDLTSAGALAVSELTEEE